MERKQRMTREESAATSYSLGDNAQARMATGVTRVTPLAATPRYGVAVTSFASRDAV